MYIITKKRFKVEDKMQNFQPFNIVRILCINHSIVAGVIRSPAYSE